MRQKHNKDAEQKCTKHTQKHNQQNAHENRKDFKFFEKTSMEEICLVCGENWLQARDIATENVQSPSVERERGTATVPT